MLRRAWGWILGGVLVVAAYLLGTRRRGASESQDAPHSGSTAEQTEQPISPERRRFLARIGIAAGGVGAAVAAVPAVGLLVAPVRRTDAAEWRPVGAVEDFAIGSTVKVSFLDPQPLPWAGFASRSAAWLRRVDESQFEALSLYCTHTGCPVHWIEKANLFLCPCHGGSFHRDGSVAGGPPPRPLGRIGIRVVDGQVEVQTSPVPLPERID